MAFEMPLDQIKQLQILLRQKANLSWYQPEKENNLALPKLPSVAETVAKLDPSPPYLRCKNCNGRLLRDLQSFICVFCGTNPHQDLPPEPIKFKNTIGYRWLLESLNLDGSEMVAPTLEENASNRGRSESKDEIPLSKLIDLEIRWPSEADRTLSNNSDSTAFPGKSSLNLAGVDLDIYFDRRDSDSYISEQKLTSRVDVGATPDSTSKDNDNPCYFQNVQASEAATGSTEDQSGDSFSGWEADFMSANSCPVQEGSKSNFHFKVESDSVSANWNDSVGVKNNDDFNPSASTENDGFQGDEWRTSKPALHNQSGNSEPGMNLNQKKMAETASSSSTRNFDWMQDDQCEGSDNKTPDMVVNEADDSFDTWNDFTGSVSTRDLSSVDSAQVNDTKTAESASSFLNKDFDWMQDNNNKTTDNISTNEPADSFDAWNDFTGSANAQYSTTGVSNSEITGQTGIFELTEDPNDSKTAESAAGSSSNFDWMQDETWQGSNNKAIGIVTSNENTDSFDAWNDFTGSAISQFPSANVSNYQTTGQTGKSEISTDLNDSKTEEGADASSAKSFDLMQDDQWQVSNNKTTDTKTANDIADYFDVWNDFTSLATTQDPSDNVRKQMESQTSAEKASETDLFSSSNNSHDVDFGGFPQHGLLLGQFDNPMTSPPATNARSAAASSNRVADLDTTRGNSGDDVEMLMSQMHDLSFMLGSNLSVPPK